jgi:uncharacterized membrane protein
MSDEEREPDPLDPSADAVGRDDAGRAEAANQRYAHLPENVRLLLEKYPMLGESQHPRIVHFPMAAAVLSPFFNLAYLLSGRKSLEETAFHLNLIGLASVPPVVLSGVVSWWINYRSHWFRNIKVKTALSPLVLAGFAALVVMRVHNPSVMEEAGAERRYYLGLSLSMPLMAGVMGYFGGKIVHRH